jgi:VWFA-related protein
MKTRLPRLAKRKAGRHCIITSLYWTILLLTPLLPQEQFQEKTRAVNIEVPVRVFEGGQFVTGLTPADFEVLENGVVQDVLACYSIEAGKKENSTRPVLNSPGVPDPVLARTFILIFELNSFRKGPRDALDYVIGHGLRENDTLFVATPIRTYRIGPESPSRREPAALTKALQNRLSDDIQKASSELRFLMSDYLSVAQKEDLEIAVGRQDTLKDLLSRIRQCKTVDESRLTGIAKAFSTIPGQKHVLLFLEKEDALMKRVRTSGLDQSEVELFKMEMMRDVQFNIDRLSRVFSQNQLDFNFIFITSDEALQTSLEVHPSSWGDYEKIDITGEFFSVFRKIAQMTGGLTISSQNPLASTKKAVEVADRFYLLYYQPKNATMDGTFREIKVRVKDRNYTIFHRQGYLAVDADRVKAPFPVS